ncbi:MAG: 2-amino-4-hydroxy-6-hydroxymethyldihydropteridine diphosphokinase [Candidatus Palauibacterales bacterium]|nr:2-amino-4-hydroxy-6-hydroxymethyldihydropteridine diphosphokinase [Candidatus Palauibacterales bacterium]
MWTEVAAVGRAEERPAAGARVAVGIGSNLGDREECLRFAARELERCLERLRTSSVYRSPPREGARGGGYLNMCVAGVWRGDGPAGRGAARRVLDQLRYVELGAGRSLQRSPGEPRCLDLDLLLVDDLRIREAGLEVPHPRMAERGFVLRPLSELVPEWRHPVVGETVTELARRHTSPGLEPYRASNEIT